jgi:hypothetical protein
LFKVFSYPSVVVPMPMDEDVRAAFQFQNVPGKSAIHSLPVIRSGNRDHQNVADLENWELRELRELEIE